MGPPSSTSRNLATGRPTQRGGRVHDVAVQPLPGMSIVGEYPSRLGADLASALLLEAGYESTVLGDPSYSIAPHHVVERGFRVAVRDEVADIALSLLTDDRAPDHEADLLDSIFHMHRFADRPKWIRWVTMIVLVSFAGPILLVSAALLLDAVGSLFP